MKKILEFGRKAMFYVRVLSGYEERRIRSYRLQLEKRLRSAQEKKVAATKIPEQIMLSEVRRMVEEMQNLNKRLEDMENDINEYFKPVDKEVETLMNMQMEKEKATMEMMGSMYKQALIEKADKQANDVNNDNQAKMETMSGLFKQALLQKAEAEATAKSKNPQKQAKSSSLSEQG